jgi:DNA (cytosine-5)-methyltransferase 1
VLDLFSGCGGISLGFSKAGYDIYSGIDFEKDSIATYNRNFRSANGIVADVSEFSTQSIRTNFAYGSKQIDVIVGGPPCQGFSNANRWQTEKKDPRNKLFFEFLRFVQVIEPKIILLENVPGLFIRGKGYTRQRIHELISKLGYVVSSEILNAYHYGVPQNRRRAFIVGIREDVSTTPFSFESIPIQSGCTVKEALKDLYKFEEERGSSHKFRNTRLKSKSFYSKFVKVGVNTIENHEVIYPADSTQVKISYVPQGGNWMDVPTKLFKNQRTNRHSSAFKRLHEDQPSVTIDTGNAHSNYFHPLFNRIPTVREAARIQSFPDNFVFYGSRTSQYRQVGNAVPPLLAFQIAKGILKRI